MKHFKVLVLLICLLFAASFIQGCSNSGGGSSGGSLLVPSPDNGGGETPTPPDNGGGETPTPPDNGGGETPTPPDNGGGDIGDAGTDIKWDNLPDTPVVSADKVFDKTGTETPQTPVHPDNVLSLIGLYRIAYISVKAPDGTTMPGGKMIIDKVIGSGNNMHGEFAVNTTTCTPAMGTCSSVGLNLAIAMQIKFQFANELVSQGVPESIQFLRKTVYKPLTSTDIPKEFENLGAKIEPDPNDPGNYIVNFTMTSPDIPMPKGYEMVLSLKKSKDDGLGSSTIVLDDSKYFTESSAVTGVALSQTSTDIVTGETFQLNHTITPANAANKNVTYSTSDASIATVDNSGLVTAVSVGVVDITVTTQENNKTATSTITVVAAKVPVKSISFAESAVTLDLDNADITKRSKMLTVTVLPADATDKRLTFTATPTGKVQIGTPTVSGNTVSLNVTALATGAVKITATTADGGITDELDLTIIDSTIHVSSVSLDHTTLNMHPADTEQLTPTVLPADAANKNVTYSSNNVSVATVDANGLVTAEGVGTATISVSSVDGAITAKCDITVTAKKIEVTSIDVTESSVTIPENFTTRNIAGLVTFTPSSVTDKTFTITSDNPTVVSADANNTITSFSAGTANITITSTNNSSATVTLRVTVDADFVHYPVTSISITKNIIANEIKNGESVTLTVAVEPAEATAKKYTFESSNTDVLTVNSATGVVTAVSEGSATITVTSSDINETNPKTDTYELSVWAPNDLSGLYDIKSLVITTDSGKTITSAGANADEAKGGIAINQTAGSIIVSGRFQIVSPVMYNDAELDPFRYRYFTDTKTVTERETAKDKLAAKGLTHNADGTITLVSRDETNKADITAIIERTGDYAEIKDARIFTTKINFNDPKSLEGTYKITNFTSYSFVNLFVTKIEVFVGTFGTSYKNSVQRMLGNVAINMDTTAKQANIVSKIQMNSTVLDTTNAGGAGIDTRDQQFQLTEYNTQSYANIATGTFGNIGSGKEADKKNGTVTLNDTAQLTVKQKFKQSVATVEVTTYITKESDVYKMDVNEVVWCYDKDVTAPADKISYIKNHYNGLACPNPEPTNGYISW